MRGRFGRLEIGIMVGLILILVALASCYWLGYGRGWADAKDKQEQKTQEQQRVFDEAAKEWSTLNYGLNTGVVTDREGELEAIYRRRAEEKARQEARARAVYATHTEHNPQTDWHGSSGVEQWDPLIREVWAAEIAEHGEHLVVEIKQVMEGESHGDPIAGRHHDYVGLMQVGMDAYWTRERLEDPRQNLDAARIQWRASRWVAWSVKPGCGGCF